MLFDLWRQENDSVCLISLSDFAQSKNSFTIIHIVHTNTTILDKCPQTLTPSQFTVSRRAPQTCTTYAVIAALFSWSDSTITIKYNKKSNLLTVIGLAIALPISCHAALTSRIHYVMGSTTNSNSQ